MQLVDLLRFYLSFPIHDHTGDPLSEEDINLAHYDKVRRRGLRRGRGQSLGGYKQGWSLRMGGKGCLWS